MKYLFYRELSQLNQEEREAEETAYFKRVQEYLELFETITHCFSTKFVSVYKKHGFHDYNLISIENSLIGKQSIKLIFEHKNQSIELIFKNIQSFHCSMNGAEGNVHQVIEYEILPFGDGCFSHEFSLSSKQSRIYIIAEKVILKNIPNNRSK